MVFASGPVRDVPALPSAWTARPVWPLRIRRSDDEVALSVSRDVAGIDHGRSATDGVHRVNESRPSRGGLPVWFS